jgi:hypothetical protein
MAELIKFARMRTLLILIVYGAFLYFCAHPSRAASRVLSSMARRSHASILSWFRSLSFLFMDRTKNLYDYIPCRRGSAKRSKLRCC